MMRTGLVTVIFLALLLVGCVVYPGIGARFIAPQTVLQAFLHFEPQNFDHNVIVRLRLPRLAAALLTGASLGVAASALGLAFPVGRPLLASTGGALLFLLILLLSSAGRSGLTPMKVTLCGVALSAFVSSITAAILILDEQTLLAMRTWLAGDLAGQDWATLGTSAWFSLGGVVLAIYLAPSLNMLALGDRMAQGLGVSVLRTRTFTLLAIALLCGAAVSIAGPIGFVGLLVPQIVRRLVSADLRVLLPLSACVGALLLLLADIIARTLFTPHELATGVMTALVGAPVFVIMATRMFK
ncbi:iron ABC transporter permease [Escherichia coli]|nr:iron ABC transporter permease [Escherichia coli]EHH6966159.1 iron ABC transporter permease [Escherichia coli]EHL6847433.1 iron ABC transporter permease [Escherichia coli]EHN2596408.1 iron ABC transporter permease [Escherichia coli]EHN2611240.1 iron ABC transporter permease [Escherichia coli]